MKKTYLLLFLLISGFAYAAPGEFADNIVTITVTSQGYDRLSPWQKLSVQKDVISGVVIGNNRILTVSYKLADHMLVEVSKFGALRKYPAEVILKDYQCGLALLTVKDISFFKGLKPAELGVMETGNEKAQIVKWEKNATLKRYGAEYLKSSVEFFDSSGAVLIHRMVSDIDSAGHGESVFIRGKLAGISSWHDAESKTVKVIDAGMIGHLLRDEARGYKGMPFFSIEDAPLGNDENLRDYLGLREEDTGVLVVGVPPYSSGSDVLKKGDVITSIDGIHIDDNGLYESGKYGRLNYFGLIYLNHFVDDTVSMEVIRDKKKINAVFKLKPLSSDSFLIPPVTYDAQPKYYIAGGLVFQELTKEYLKTWGKEWMNLADKRLMYYYDTLSSAPGADRRRVVLLSTVLPASVNIGYHYVKNIVLRKVNGIIVRDINHLKEIIDNSNDKYLIFEFPGEQNIVIDSIKAKSSMEDILRKYSIETPYYVGKE